MNPDQSTAKPPVEASAFPYQVSVPRGAMNPITGRIADCDQVEVFTGATLRDYFAASALQTMNLANSWSDNPLYWDGVAKSAYVCADAMLKARQA